MWSTLRRVLWALAAISLSRTISVRSIILLRIENALVVFFALLVVCVRMSHLGRSSYTAHSNKKKIGGGNLENRILQLIKFSRMRKRLVNKTLLIWLTRMKKLESMKSMKSMNKIS